MKKILTWFLPLGLVLGLSGSAVATHGDDVHIDRDASVVDAGTLDAGPAPADAGTLDAGPTGDPAPGTDLPDGTPDPSEDTLGFMEEVYTALTEGKYMVAFALVLILLIQLFKWAGVKVVSKVSEKAGEWLKTKLGKYVVSFGLALGMAAATALLAGNPVSLGLLSTALAAAWTASGGWEQFNDVISFINSKKDQKAE